MEDSEVIFSQVTSSNTQTSYIAKLPSRCSKHLGRFQKCVAPAYSLNNIPTMSNLVIHIDNPVIEIAKNIEETKSPKRSGILRLIPEVKTDTGAVKTDTGAVKTNNDSLPSIIIQKSTPEELKDIPTKEIKPKITYVMIQTKDRQKKVVPYDENVHNWVKKKIAPNGASLEYCSWCSGKVKILSTPKYAFWDTDNNCYDTCHDQEMEEEKRNIIEREKMKTRINGYLLNSEKAIQVHREFMESKTQFIVDTKSIIELEKKIEKSRGEINHQDPTYVALFSASQRLADEIESTKESAAETYDNLLSRGLVKENTNKELYIKQRIDDREKELSKARAELTKWVNHQKMMVESKDIRELEMELSRVRRQNESNILALRRGAERPFYYIYSSYIELSEVASISVEELERKKSSINLNRYVFPNISRMGDDYKSLVNEIYIVISKTLDEYLEYIPKKEWKCVYERLRNNSRFEKECKNRLKIHGGVIKTECRAAIFGSKTIRSSGEIVETKNLPQQLVAIIPKKSSKDVDINLFEESTHDVNSDKLDQFQERELQYHS